MVQAIPIMNTNANKCQGAICPVAITIANSVSNMAW